MHLILMTRGIQQSRDIWKQFMCSQMFHWVRRPMLKDEKGNFIEDGVDEQGNKKYKLGEPELTLVQGSLRPFELFEYVFPKDSARMKDGKIEVIPDGNLKEVLAMQNAQSVFPLRPEVQIPGWILRKAMGGKQIPQYVLDAIKGKQQWEITKKYIPMQGMAVYPIGIKDDRIGCEPAYGFEQEML